MSTVAPASSGAARSPAAPPGAVRRIAPFAADRAAGSGPPDRDGGSTAAPWLHPRGRRGTAGISSGSSSVNTEPTPTSDDASIRPPSIRASSREIDRPSPVPPYLRLVVPSACWNASKIISSLSLGMPMPLSRTANAITECAPSSAGTPWTVPPGAR